MPITAAIFAGGQSRRMGQDKAMLEIDGLRLLERVVVAALAAVLPVLVVGRARPIDWVLEKVAFAEDDWPGCGPLGGLHTALSVVKAPVLAVACDMPCLTADALRWLAGQAAERVGEHGLVVINAGRWEPLFSCYTPACLTLLEAQLSEGRLSLHSLIEAGEFGQVEAPDWLTMQLLNVNTPEDLQRLSQR